MDRWPRPGSHRRPLWAQARHDPVDLHVRFRIHRLRARAELLDPLRPATHHWLRDGRRILGFRRLRHRVVAQAHAQQGFGLPAVGLCLRRHRRRPGRQVLRDMGRFDAPRMGLARPVPHRNHPDCRRDLHAKDPARSRRLERSQGERARRKERHASGALRWGTQDPQLRRCSHRVRRPTPDLHPAGRRRRGRERARCPVRGYLHLPHHPVRLQTLDHRHRDHADDLRLLHVHVAHPGPAPHLPARGGHGPDGCCQRGVFRWPR